MMTNRELIELAAKAAGVALKPMQVNNVSRQGDDRFVGYMTSPKQWSRGWFDPLNDDSDALRLAVKLLFEIDMTKGCVAVRHLTGVKILEAFNNDPCKATRRAIVLAAAEIGKNMGGNDD